MNVKNVVIVVLIIALLTFCMPNVAAAPVSKQTINVHSSYATDIPSKDQPILVLLLSNNVTNVGQSVDLFGLLATFRGDKINNIEDATIHIEQLNYYGTSWDRLGDLTTMSGNFSGFFTTRITPSDPGAYVYRATFDGDSQYAPAASHWVALRAYS
jgi:hypothetical protein